MVKRECPECKSIHLTYDAHLGEVVCNGCGLVIEDGEIDIPTKRGREDFSQIKKYGNLKGRVNKIKTTKTKEDQREISEVELKKTIRECFDEFNVPPNLQKEIKPIILKMHKNHHFGERNQLNGIDNKITICAVILHFLNQNQFNNYDFSKESLKKLEEKIKLLLQKLQEGNKEIILNEMEKIDEVEGLFEDAKNDSKYWLFSYKKKNSFLQTSDSNVGRIINRLKNHLYSKNILPFPKGIELNELNNLEHIKHMDYHFLKSFEDEERFFSLLKCNDDNLKKEKILELRNNTPKNAITHSYFFGIYKEKKDELYSKKWKGFFCTYFYYLIKDCFNGEFKENCPSINDFLKFFEIGKGNFQWYLRILREGSLSEEGLTLLKKLN